MSGLTILFLVLNALALLALPRRWAALPLLIGACYMTLGQAIEVGPFSFTVIRILALVGFVRVLLRGERPAGGMNGLDWLMLAWAAWALTSSVFHNEPQKAWVFRLGLVYNTIGFYFLIRCFCHGLEDAVQLILSTAILLTPVALEMVHEQMTGRNLFSAFGGVPEEVVVRNDRLRSQGPFAHAILAGTIGAVCVPLMTGVWRKTFWLPKVGLTACLVMVITSASSGPLMSLLLSGLALLLWPWRHLTRQMRIAAVAGYLLLDLVMKAPAYYLIARIDLTGGSTGWHRAYLIESSLKHLQEWYLAGTDYTRHWMPTGVSWSPDHTDITNHYLQLGVVGGLPLMILFIAILCRAFSYIGHVLHFTSGSLWEDQFLFWALGASLFAHATTCISVSYFDQSFLFLYLDLAIVSSLRQTFINPASVARPKPTALDDIIGQAMPTPRVALTSPDSSCHSP